MSLVYPRDQFYILDPPRTQNFLNMFGIEISALGFMGSFGMMECKRNARS
jgi:hypothetical protein